MIGGGQKAILERHYSLSGENQLKCIQRNKLRWITVDFGGFP